MSEHECPCPDCDGDGDRMDGYMCPTCHGTGKAEQRPPEQERARELAELYQDVPSFLGDMCQYYLALATAHQQSLEREREAWQMIGAMLTENGGPFRVSSKSLRLAPHRPTLERADDPTDGSVLLSLAANPSEEEAETAKGSGIT